MPPIKRALLSVFDKTGVVDFARNLIGHGVEILSTGGTARHLQEHGISTVSISEVTDFPEILGGRVKTLHPKIFGGLLALRHDGGQMQQVKKHDIGLIDMVVVNLYPFESTVARPDVTQAEAVENIDIGGPSMIRAAAKNHMAVAVVTSSDQYEMLAKEMNDTSGQLSDSTRKSLAAAAFARTCQYDASIAAFLKGDSAGIDDSFQLSLQKSQSLRYGENPHQSAALFQPEGEAPSGLLNARQIHGKELSYNNFIDTDAAVGIVQEFDEPCCVVIKHTNPCGVATSSSLVEAYQSAKATDPVSAFGGIVGLNRALDSETASAISEVFTEVVIAPAFEAGAVEILQAKKNLRLLEMPEIAQPRGRTFEFKRVQGGVLVQDQDFMNINDIDLRVVSKRQPSQDEWLALKFGWRVCKWVKSNAIVYSTSDRTIGVGAGQMSRVDSSKFAVDKARRMGLNLKGTVMSSDAFLPFRDGLDVAAEVGATAVIQPGCSVRDNEVIEAADQHRMAMVFTGIRHFRH